MLGVREFDDCIGARPVQALVRWGGALMELAHFKQGKESVEMIQQVRRVGCVRELSAGGMQNRRPDDVQALSSRSAVLHLRRLLGIYKKRWRWTQSARTRNGAWAMPTHPWCAPASRTCTPSTHRARD